MPQLQATNATNATQMDFSDTIEWLNEGAANAGATGNLVDNNEDPFATTVFDETFVPTATATAAATITTNPTNSIQHPRDNEHESSLSSRTSASISNDSEYILPDSVDHIRLLEQRLERLYKRKERESQSKRAQSSARLSQDRHFLSVVQLDQVSSSSNTLVLNDESHPAGRASAISATREELRSILYSSKKDNAEYIEAMYGAQSHDNPSTNIHAHVNVDEKAAETYSNEILQANQVNVNSDPKLSTFDTSAGNNSPSSAASLSTLNNAATDFMEKDPDLAEMETSDGSAIERVTADGMTVRVLSNYEALYLQGLAKRAAGESCSVM